MEYGAYWMTVIVVLLLLALFAQRAIEIYNDVRRYVVRWELPVVRNTYENARVPDTEANEPLPVPPRTTSTELVPNRETLIRIAALMVNEDGSYTYSANKIAEFIGGTRGATLDAIRAARGTPEPPTNDPYQFEKTGPRETYQRTGVGPLRG